MIGTASSTENHTAQPGSNAMFPILPRDVDHDPSERDAIDPLDDALRLIAAGRPREADLLLTAALVAYPGRDDLWLAAGIARTRRGALHSAAAAFEMAAWIGDDPLARELLAEIGDQIHSQESRSQAPPAS
jgi:hypothetical protein